jgi:putative ABC transport system ATP-binding protein
VSVLDLRDVVKLYPVGDGEPVRAVDGVSLMVARSELIALYGPSGAGKTTLLMLIAGLLAPDCGSVRMEGREVSRMSVREAASYRLWDLGFVRQSLNLLAGASALDNASLKLMGTDLTPREAHRRVLPLLERLGLGERVGQRAEQLSMGERQRVMIARALSTEPKLVLADEPTGNLDSVRGSEVLSLLRELCHEREIAVVLVTHDLAAATHADRVHTLRDGLLVERGPEQLIVHAGAQ